MVRYSSMPGKLAVSYVDNNEVCKALIGYDTSGFWMEEGAANPQKYPTLEALAAGSSQILQIPKIRAA